MKLIVKKNGVGLLLIGLISISLSCSLFESKKQSAGQRGSATQSTDSASTDSGIGKSSTFKDKIGEPARFGTFSLDKSANPENLSLALSDSSIDKTDQSNMNLISSAALTNEQYDGLRYNNTEPSPLYNPTLNYPTSIATDNLFDPCKKFDAPDDSGQSISSQYIVDHLAQGNYMWLFAQAVTKNMGESDLSKNSFGNKDAGNTWKNLKDYTVDLTYATSKANDLALCKDSVWKQVEQTSSTNLNFSTEKDHVADYGRHPDKTFIRTVGKGPFYDEVTVKAVLSENYPVLNIEFTQDGGVKSDKVEITIQIPEAVNENNNNNNNNTPVSTTTWQQVKTAIDAHPDASKYVTIELTDAIKSQVVSQDIEAKVLAGAWLIGRSDGKTAKDFIQYTSITNKSFATMVQCIQTLDTVKSLLAKNKATDAQRFIQGGSLAQINTAEWLKSGHEVIEPDYLTTEWKTYDKGIFGQGLPKIYTEDIKNFNITSSPATYDRYGRQVTPPKCLLSGVPFPQGHICSTFCYVAQPVAKDYCYHSVTDGKTADPALDVKLNNRRRAIMSNENNQDGGLLYMSIKVPNLTDSNYKVINARVMHNLHESHMFGASGGIEVPNYAKSLAQGKDGNSWRNHSFTFNIPFCPKLDTMYEYRVCNVPKTYNETFGTNCSPSEKSCISNCFDTRAEHWGVSDVTVAEMRVGDPTWSAASFWDAKNNTYMWEKTYQLLKNTYFFISKAKGSLLADGDFSTSCLAKAKDSEGKDIEIPNGYGCKNEEDVKTSICNSSVNPRGMRLIKNSHVWFKYRTHTDTEKTFLNRSAAKEMNLYLDTNPLKDHYFHKGWADETGNDIAMNQDGTPASEDYLVKPASLVDKRFQQCYTTQTGALKSTIFDTQYSPLVFNINHTGEVGLVGIDADVSYLGRPFYAEVPNRAGIYDKQVMQSIAPDESAIAKTGSTVYPSIQKEGIDNAFVKTGWIDGASGSALLVLDLNNNGKIDSSFELFGHGTIIESGRDFGMFGVQESGDFAKNGFVALAQYDENKDGWVDAKDSIFSKLQAWQDGKAGVPNGEVDDGELLSIADLNITGFNVNQVKGIHVVDSHGNQTLYRSNYKFKNAEGVEKENTIFDVYFIYNELSNEERGLSLTDEEKAAYNLLKAQIEEVQAISEEFKKINDEQK